jgi:hypothetical protein
MVDKKFFMEKITKINLDDERQRKSIEDGRELIQKFIREERGEESTLFLAAALDMWATMAGSYGQGYRDALKSFARYTADLHALLVSAMFAGFAPEDHETIALHPNGDDGAYLVDVTNEKTAQILFKLCRDGKLAEMTPKQIDAKVKEVEKMVAKGQKKPRRLAQPSRAP